MYSLNELKFISENSGKMFKVLIYDKNNTLILNNEEPSKLKPLDIISTKENYIMYESSECFIVSNMFNCESEYVGKVEGDLYLVSPDMLIDLDKYYNKFNRIEIKNIKGDNCFFYYTSILLNNKKVKPDLNGILRSY